LPVSRAQLGWFSPAALNAAVLPLPAQPAGLRPGKSARSHTSSNLRTFPLWESRGALQGSYHRGGAALQRRV